MKERRFFSILPRPPHPSTNRRFKKRFLILALKKGPVQETDSILACKLPSQLSWAFSRNEQGAVCGALLSKDAGAVLAVPAFWADAWGKRLCTLHGAL